MDVRVAVDLAGRRQEELRALGPAQPESVVRAEAADLERLDRELEIVARRGGACEM